MKGFYGPEQKHQPVSKVLGLTTDIIKINEFEYQVVTKMKIQFAKDFNVIKSTPKIEVTSKYTIYSDDRESNMTISMKAAPEE